MTRETLCQIIAGVIGIFVITPAMFLILDRRDPAIMESARIVPHDLRPGQAAKVVMTFKNVRPGCSGVVRRKIIDRSGRIVNFAQQSAIFYSDVIKEGVPFEKELIIPEGLTPGPAIYDPSVWRWCNELQRIVWPIRSSNIPIHFNILGDDTK